MDRHQQGPPGRTMGANVGGSSRAKQMLAMATGGKGGKGGGRPASGVAPPTVTFARRNKQPQKREAEGDSLFPLFGTPKKQRTPSSGERSGGAAPPSAPRPPPSLGPAAPAPVPALRNATCTQQITCYSNKQRLREKWQEGEEERRRGLYSSSGSSFGGGVFRRGGSGGASAARGSGLARLPAGMLNLGNTCYLNAVLQALLSLPCFVGDLRRGRQQLEAAGQPLSSSGVFSALLDCVAARDNSMASYITPASLKRALDASSATFHGAFQQDAHELFVSLLEGVQREVLAREVARLGRSRVRISETADPAARNFSFAVEHELACSRCGHTSRLVEEYMHLSLELPEAQPGVVAASSIATLLREYFKEEEVEKSCDSCGGANLPHSLQHSIKRLPRVLVLHMKRFKVSWSAERQQAVCQKLHTQVSIPEVVQLAGFLAAATVPPLPGGQQQEQGKENQQRDANAQEGSAAAAAGREKSKLLRRSGVSFYGLGSGGGGMATPVASSALLSPADCELLRSPTLRGRQATPVAAIKPGGLGDYEDADLQQALAASMLEQQHGQQQAPAGQRQFSPPPAAGALLRRHVADEEEITLIRAGSPGGSAAAAVLPPEVEAAAAAASAAHASGGHGSHGLQDEWWMGMGRPAGSPCKPTAAQKEEEELQRVLELSRMEHEQQQRQQEAAVAVAEAGRAAVGSSSDVENAAGALAALGAPADLAAAAREQEEADLQRAMELSLLEQQHGGGSAASAAVAVPGQAPVSAAAAAAEQHVGQHVGQSSQQQQQQGCHSFLDIFREVMEQPADGAEARAAPPAVAAAPDSAAHQHQQQQQQQQGMQAAAGGEQGQAEDEVTEVMEAGGEGAAAEQRDEAAGGIEVGATAGAGTAAAAAAAGAGAAAETGAAYLQAQIVEDDDSQLAAEVEEGDKEEGAAEPAGGGGGHNGADAAAAAAAGGGPGVPSKPPAAQYRLQAVVNHKGPAASCGHFTSDIRDPASGQWHRFDDSVASRITGAEACSCEKQRECYLLFYVI